MNANNAAPEQPMHPKINFLGFGGFLVVPGFAGGWPGRGGCGPATGFAVGAAGAAGLGATGAGCVGC
jgi:hypothetical protein